MKKTAEEKEIFLCQSANVALNADCSQIVHFEAAKGFSLIIFLGRLVLFYLRSKAKPNSIQDDFFEKKFFCCTLCFFLGKTKKRVKWKCEKLRNLYGA